MRRTHRARGVLGALVTLVFACGETRAGDPPPVASGDIPFYWTISAGSFRVGENSDLFSGDRSTVMLGGGLAQRIRPGLAVDFQLLLYGGRIDAPPMPPPIFGTIADHYDLTAGLMALAVQLEVPRGPVRPFAGAGGGLYLTKIVRTGTVFGIPGTVDKDNDVSLTLSLDAGLAFVFTPKTSLTIEYRRLFARTHFESISPDTVDLGGDVFLAGFRYAFEFKPPSRETVPRRATSRAGFAGRRRRGEGEQDVRRPAPNAR